MKRQKQVTRVIQQVVRRSRVVWWDGKPAVVKLDDWAEFADTNRLCVVCSRIEGQDGGRLQVVVEVIRDV